jgi:hypothetical protein
MVNASRPCCDAYMGWPYHQYSRPGFCQVKSFQLDAVGRLAVAICLPFRQQECEHGALAALPSIAPPCNAFFIRRRCTSEAPLLTGFCRLTLQTSDTLPVSRNVPKLPGETHHTRIRRWIWVMATGLLFWFQCGDMFFNPRDRRRF